MLIIFDLDDTLIDTSGAVTPFKMRLCLEKLIEGGLQVSDFGSAYAKLLEINRSSPKSTEAIERFARERGAGDLCISLAIKELFTPLPKDFAIPTTPCAKDILAHYAAVCPVALVTGGDPSFQRDKLEKAGIDSSVFSMIAIPEDSVKKPFYEVAQRKFLKRPDEVWVCGDRIAMDLAPARELGFHTVHMRWGRGALAAKEPWIEHSISDLRELKGKIK